MRKSSSPGLFYVISCAFLWGILPIFLRKSLQYTDVYTVVAIRFAGASLLLSILLFVIKKEKWVLFPIPKLLWVSFLGLISNYLLIMMGVKWAGPATSGLVIQSGPMLFVLGGMLFFGERLSLRQKIGFPVVIIGFWLYYRSQMAQETITDQTTFTQGVFATLAAGLGWAIYSLAQKKLVQKYPPQQLNLFIYAASAITMSFFADFGAIAEWDNTGLSVITFLVLSTLISYGFMAEAMKLLPANKIGIIVSLNPILLFFALIVLKEIAPEWITQKQFGWLSYISAAIILSGAVLVVGGKGKRE